MSVVAELSLASAVVVSVLMLVKWLERHARPGVAALALGVAIFVLVVAGLLDGLRLTPLLFAIVAFASLYRGAVALAKDLWKNAK